MAKIGDKVKFKEGYNRNSDCVISDIFYHEGHGGVTYYYFDGNDRNSGAGWDDTTFTVVSEESQFTTDNRNNPKLHKLYVGYALETLGVISEAISELDSHSRVTSSLLAGVLRGERAKLVKNDAAYFEAAAILFVGEDWYKEA